MNSDNGKISSVTDKPKWYRSRLSILAYLVLSGLSASLMFTNERDQKSLVTHQESSNNTKTIELNPEVTEIDASTAVLGLLPESDAFEQQFPVYSIVIHPDNASSYLPLPPFEQYNDTFELETPSGSAEISVGVEKRSYIFGESIKVRAVVYPENDGLYIEARAKLTLNYAKNNGESWSETFLTQEYRQQQGFHINQGSEAMYFYGEIPTSGPLPTKVLTREGVIFSVSVNGNKYQTLVAIDLIDKYGAKIRGLRATEWEDENLVMTLDSDIYETGWCTIEALVVDEQGVPQAILQELVYLQSNQSIKLRLHLSAVNEMKKRDKRLFLGNIKGFISPENKPHLKRTIIAPKQLISIKLIDSDEVD